MANMIVSGAGSSECNGTYVETSVYNDKPSYSKGVEEEIYWDGTRWRIYNGGIYYYSTENVATPDLVVTWQKQFGVLPLPTVTAEQSGTTHEGEVTFSSLSYLRTKKA